MLFTVYVISVIYCIYKMYRRYTKDKLDPVHATPGLETLAILAMAPVLMAVDASITWVRLYKEADEVKRNREKVF